MEQRLHRYDIDPPVWVPRKSDTLARRVNNPVGPKREGVAVQVPDRFDTSRLIDDVDRAVLVGQLVAGRVGSYSAKFIFNRRTGPVVGG